MPESATYSELPLRKKIVYILGFLLLGGTTFLLGVWFMFPDASLERRINAELARQAPIGVKVHHLERRFPLTLLINSVDIAAPGLPLSIESLQARPAWSRFIQLQAGIYISGMMFNGHFDILHTSTGATEIEAKNMHLRAPIPGFSSIEVVAELEHAYIESDIAGAITPQNGSIRLKGVRINGLDNLGLGQEDIDLGDLELTLEANARQLDIELLNPTGTFEIVASGSITPPRLTPRGRLNLQIRIGNIPPQHAQLVELLSLAGVRKDANGYLIRLGGRLQRPFLR